MITKLLLGSFLACLLLGQTVHAEIFRISRAYVEERPGTTKFTLGKDDKFQTFFVENEALILRAEVKTVSFSASSLGALEFTLSEKGAEKLSDATKDMRFGEARLAILINDKLVSCPTVQYQLGGQFVVNGLEGSGLDLGRVIREILGKSQVEFEEGERQKKLLEPIYLEVVPEQGELDQAIKIGMTDVEVIKKFGQPHRYSGVCGKEGVSHYYLIPKSAVDLPVGKAYGIAIAFHEGKVISTKRLVKSKEASKRSVRIGISRADIEAKDFDLIKTLEMAPVTYLDGEHEPRLFDFNDLAGCVGVLRSEDISKEISLKCDVIRMLSKAVPALELIVKKTPEGKISISKLLEIMQPYLMGERLYEIDGKVLGE